MDVWRVKLLRFRGIVGLCFFAITLSSIATCNILFRTKRFGWNKALVILPFVWTLTDWFAHITPHGLQVYLLPYTQTNNICLIQFADIFGMWGVGFWVMGMNCLMIFIISKKMQFNFPKQLRWRINFREVSLK